MKINHNDPKSTTIGVKLKVAKTQNPSKSLHIYTRVSTMAQANEGTSLATQYRLGVKKAKELKLVPVHLDEGGKSSHHENIADRPVLLELYQAIKRGEVKHLWIYDQSRLSRNGNVAAMFRYELQKYGVTLYSKDGQFDLANPNENLLKQMLDAIAEDRKTESCKGGLLVRWTTTLWLQDS
jgi:DNA invertase Pin-like site-specific DNA recombinase